MVIVLSDDFWWALADILSWDTVDFWAVGFFVIPAKEESFIVLVLNVRASQMQPTKYSDKLSAFG